jgi:hypothetical protein
MRHSWRSVHCTLVSTPSLNRLALLHQLLAFSTLLVVPAISDAQQLPPLTEEMPKTYGLDSFSEVEAIRYTWGNGKETRRWVWQPKTDTVNY